MNLLEPLKKLDIFGQPLPQANLGGQEKVRTHIGGFVSLLFANITFLFAILKLQHLMSKHNPSVNSFVEEGAFDLDEKFSTADKEDFMMAFQAVTWLDGVRNDPYYVKWMATYWIFENGEYSTRAIPMRDCTESDFEKFYPPTKES